AARIPEDPLLQIGCEQDGLHVGEAQRRHLIQDRLPARRLVSSGEVSIDGQPGKTPTAGVGIVSNIQFAYFHSKHVYVDRRCRSHDSSNTSENQQAKHTSSNTPHSASIFVIFLRARSNDLWEPSRQADFLDYCYSNIIGL